MRLLPKVHIVLFDQAVVALDTDRNAYHLYNGKVARALSRIVDEGTSNYAGSDLAPMLADGVLRPFDEAGHRNSLLDRRGFGFSGFSSAAWSARHLPTDETRTFDPVDVMHLSRCSLLLRLFRFKAIYALLGGTVAGDRPSPSQTLQIADIEARRLSAAVHWCPFRVACLQWALAIAVRLRKRGIEAILHIGVRPIPFVSHAWVEVDGEVIGDAHDNRRNYASIFSYPSASGSSDRLVDQQFDVEADRQ